MTRLDEISQTEDPANIVTKWSDSIAKFSEAFVAAQLEIEGATKDKKNPHYHSDYADLASVMDACKEALNKHGIGIIQTPAAAEPGWLGLTTMLLHKSGEWMAGTGKLPIAGNGPQSYGSAMTYARRFFLAAMVGVAPVDGDPIGGDDDGERAQGRGQQRPPQRQPANGNGAAKPVAPTLATDAQMAETDSLITELKIPDEDVARTLASLRVTHWREVTEANMVKVLARLHERKRADIEAANQVGGGDDGSQEQQQDAEPTEAAEFANFIASDVNSFPKFVAALERVAKAKGWDKETAAKVARLHAATFKKTPETLGESHRARFLNHALNDNIDLESGRVKETVPAA